MQRHFQANILQQFEGHTGTCHQSCNSVSTERCRVYRRSQASHALQGRGMYLCIPQPWTSPRPVLKHMHFQLHAVTMGLSKDLTARIVKWMQSNCACSVAAPHGTAADKTCTRLLDIPVQEPSVEVVPDCVIHKSLLQLGLSSFLVSEHHIVVPSSLHLRRGDTIVNATALSATGSRYMVSTTVMAG